MGDGAPEGAVLTGSTRDPVRRRGDHSDASSGARAAPLSGSGPLGSRSPETQLAGQVDTSSKTVGYICSPERGLGDFTQLPWESPQEVRTPHRLGGSVWMAGVPARLAKAKDPRYDPSELLGHTDVIPPLGTQVGATDAPFE